MTEDKIEDYCDCNICDMIRKNTWINIKDKIPKYNKYVIVYDIDKSICLGYFYIGSWCNYHLVSFIGDGYLFKVSHWIPLPSLTTE